VKAIGLYLVIELAALVAVAEWLGFFPTLLLLLAGGLVGMALVRREGVRAGIALADAMRSGRAPHAEVTDGALIGLAGLLILLPGVVSDLLGLLLVLPFTRALVRNRLVARVEHRAPVLRTSRIRDGHTVVDGSVVYGPGGYHAGGFGPGGFGAGGFGAGGFDAGERPWSWDEPPRRRSLEP
jgi:UPF0716 protein FxsA